MVVKARVLNTGRKGSLGGLMPGSGTGLLLREIRDALRHPPAKEKVSVWEEIWKRRESCAPGHRATFSA